MAGELVPLVMLPRYSTYSGAATFTTIGMDVTDYQSVILNVWRAPLIGTSATWTITIEESTDQENWSTVTGTTPNFDPGASTEAQMSGTIKKRWLRVKVVVGGTNPSATCWAIGFLEMRES